MQEQEVAWQDATNPDDQATDAGTTDSNSATSVLATDSDNTAVNLDPPHPIDHQMICDIKTIASRLASKSHQLLGV